MISISIIPTRSQLPTLNGIPGLAYELSSDHWKREKRLCYLSLGLLGRVSGRPCSHERKSVFVIQSQFALQLAN